MSQVDYQNLMDYVDRQGGESETARTKATQDYLNALFAEKQEANAREVSQRKGVETMLKKWANEEETTGRYFFDYTAKKGIEKEGYSDEALSQLNKSPGSAAIIRPKDEKELADSFVKEYNKASPEEKSILEEAARKFGLDIQQLKSERDIMAESGELDIDRLTAAIKQYNESIKQRKTEGLTFEDYQETPEHRDLYNDLKRKGYSDLEVQDAIFRKWSVEKDKKIAKDQIDLRIKDTGEYPEKLNLKSLAINIDNAYKRGDIKTLEKIENIIQLRKTDPRFVQDQADLESLFYRAQSRKQLALGRITPDEEVFDRVLPEDVSGPELNKALKRIKLKSDVNVLRRAAEKEVSEYLSPDNAHFQSEVNRKILERSPGVITVEEKLKKRMDAKDELDFLNKISKTNLKTLKDEYGEFIIGTKSRERLLDELAIKLVPKKEMSSDSLASQRAVLDLLNDEELESAAQSEGVSLGDVDKISSDELKAVKRISKIRLKRIKER